MNKEFNLSDKQEYVKSLDEPFGFVYHLKDVKEFIRLLNIGFEKWVELDKAGLKPKYEIFSDFMKQLAGETLTK